MKCLKIERKKQKKKNTDMQDVEDRAKQRASLVELFVFIQTWGWREQASEDMDMLGKKHNVGYWCAWDVSAVGVAQGHPRDIATWLPNRDSFQEKMSHHHAGFKSAKTSQSV